MKDKNYWKNYVHDIDPGEIEKSVKKTAFKSRGLNLSLTYFENGKNSPNILCVPGSGSYALYYAELLYNMYLNGYNVFAPDFQGHGESEGARGDFTVNEILENIKDAVKYISDNYSGKTGVFGGSFGGFIAFYLALSGINFGGLVCQNPAILTDSDFHGEVTRKVRFFLPALKMLVKFFPKMKIPTALYIDADGFSITQREKSDSDKFEKDANTVKHYTLRGVMSQITTPPPAPLEKLKVPTMFLAPVKDNLTSVSYIENLYKKLPPVKKRIVEINGSHLWIHSHPKEAAKIICGWFDETL